MSLLKRPSLLDEVEQGNCFHHLGHQIWYWFWHSPIVNSISQIKQKEILNQSEHYELFQQFVTLFSCFIGYFSHYFLVVHNDLIQVLQHCRLQLPELRTSGIFFCKFCQSLLNCTFNFNRTVGLLIWIQLLNHQFMESSNHQGIEIWNLKLSKSCF